MDTLSEAIKEVQGKRILISPLNWGLGHATRCVPVIRALQKENKEILLAADGVALDFLQNTFPEIESIELKDLRVRYAQGNSQLWSMIKQTPRFLIGIIKEHKALKGVVKKHNIDTVISDNRFGLWNRHCESIYITHQLMIKMTPKTQWLEHVVWRMHRFIINKFDHCWIPDFSGKDNLSGDLSHKYPLPKNGRFIGVLSRFNSDHDITNPSPYNTIILISGPEPHRSMMEERAIHHFSKTEQSTLILRGQPHLHVAPMHIGNITLMSHMDTAPLQDIMQNSENIICRSGYSSLMDLYTIKRKAILIPTPGQTEQEYLGNYFKEKGFIVIEQDKW